MDTAKLARMGNQIAAFFRSYPEEQAVASIRDHVRQFWTPKMRETARAACERGEGGFDPLVVRALVERERV
ncbi:formate dehydrogenase subunit delta [uncultured Alsobacter sp.]|uniref:formate dehydrogenase subunit delta n=1 Tax=uncultured Alsobacter sp. TaxID=1748258 RepID=UPI0025CFA8A2|nr:formate dehydrogenase subunit delta [uncultured Alsobacter sp.]